MRIPAPNFTQAPNELFDEWLTKLTHIQLKVLMVIMRKTFGWHKIRDRISLSQLETLTGSGRSKIIKATKVLEKLNLITKEVSGKNGDQQTFYELVVIEDSNNNYQCPKDTPPSVQKTPTKETLTKYKKKNIIKRNPKEEPPRITFNAKTRQFEGIQQDDIDSWRKAHPAVNVLKVIDECAIWAFSNPREHYRISLNTFMANKEKTHTTPYKEPEQKLDVLDEDVIENMRLAKEWEKEYECKKIRNYELYARPTNILFVFPNNSGDLISYEMPTREFLKKCLPYLRKLRI